MAVVPALLAEKTLPQMRPLLAATPVWLRAIAEVTVWALGI